MKKGILLLILLALITGCSQVEQQEAKSAVINALELPEVQVIRAMEMDNGVKLGELFEAGLSSPTYELFDPAEDGNTYVNIQGNASLNGQNIVVTVQYKQMDDESYDFHVVAFNDIPQNLIQANGFFEFLYEEYDKINEIETIDQNVNSGNNSEDVDILFNSNQELLNFLNDNRFLFIDDANWFYEFDTNRTVYGILDGGYWVEEKYEVKEVNYNENFIIINILESTTNSEDGTTIDETNHLQKVIIEENILQIIAFFGTEDEVTSYWILADD